MDPFSLIVLVLAVLIVFWLVRRSIKRQRSERQQASPQKSKRDETPNVGKATRGPVMDKD